MFRFLPSWTPWLLVWALALQVRAAPPEPATAAPGTPAPLILISLDGYRADYLDRGHSPALAALAADGVRAKALRPVFPSLTYPNHYTLVTGLYPDQHGIVGNTMRDPVLGEFSPPNRAANADGRWWAQAEPIWVTAEKRGRTTAAEFWPGTQAEIRGVRPTYWQPFDASVAPETRVDQVLAWLDLPVDRRPGFILLYLEQIDVVGHGFGPDSPQLQEALAAIDSALARLIDGLRRRGLYDSTNIVVVSDHGMSATSPERVVLLDSIVNAEHIGLVSSGAFVGINPKPPYAAEVEGALAQPHPHVQCWKKENIPTRYHYGTNARIPALICVAEPGWMVTTAAIAAKVSRPPLGGHGYDIDEPTMRALFVGRGPSFRQNQVVPELDNINVYALLATVLEIEPLSNEGSATVTQGMLRAPGRPASPAH